MSKVLDEAKRYARMGHSLSFAAQLLGISAQKLRQIAPEVEFAKMGRSAASQWHHESRRDRPAHPNCIAALARGRAKKRLKFCHNAFGVIGTVEELIIHFKCGLSKNGILRRLQIGFSIEDALTTPRINPFKKGETPEQFKQQIVLNRLHLIESRLYPAIWKRLTPTMLCYRTTAHDLTIIGKKELSKITVEVRERDGTLVHRLRFVTSYKESGVLFIFNAHVWGQLDFLAFEPDTPCLQNLDPVYATPAPSALQDTL